MDAIISSKGNSVSSRAQGAGNAIDARRIAHQAVVLVEDDASDPTRLELVEVQLADVCRRYGESNGVACRGV